MLLILPRITIVKTPASKNEWEHSLECPRLIYYKRAVGGECVRERKAERKREFEREKT
jgi:hypothetical protein